MLKKKQFDILRYICENGGGITQRLIAEETGLSLGTVNSVVTALKKDGLIDPDYRITEAGAAALAPYRVDNAIILAAGMSTRFIPVSYELPKGLISVKGDVMVERLIRQLQEAGVPEIVLVVGYMMEKFFYLREKYGVKLVVNNEYATKNTHSSIYAARGYLRNTYICCSDNYYPQNMFHRYEYRAFYCSVFMPGVSYVERAFSFHSDGLIYDTNKPSRDQWIMYGHAYYDAAFTERFLPILESYYGRPGIEYMYWETIYAENVRELPMWIQQCTPDKILEFDSMEELKAFDPDYIRHNRVKIFENICRILQCELSDITDIEPLKKGLNNRSFKFLCRGEWYIYRHPGANADAVIDRKKEAISLRTARDLQIDDTLIHIDADDGWKISRFIQVTETFDFSNKKHIQMLADHLKTLHSSGVRVGFSFDYRREADRLIDNERHVDALSWRRLDDAREMMGPIFRWLERDPWQFSLCHNDIYEPNLLVHDDRLSLIDWEFAGDGDIGFDICKLFSVHDPAYEEIDEWLYTYYGRETTPEEKIHLLACAAVIYYYWYVWGVFFGKNSDQTAQYIMTWFDKMNHFAGQAIQNIDPSK